MADVELALRFLAFNLQEDVYRGNLKGFLDSAVEKFNSEFEDGGEDGRITNALEEFDRAIEAALAIFGTEHACRKWKGGAFETRFNRAVFDIQIGALADSKVREWALSNRETMSNAFANVSAKDESFIESLETTTKSIGAVRKRFDTWFDAVSKMSGIPLAAPKTENENSN